MAKPKRGRPPKPIDDHELSIILTYARRHGTKSASERFDVSDRTIQRRMAAMREGKLPVVAKLVDEREAQSLERCASVLDETYEHLLQELQSRAKTATTSELIEAVRTVGELQVSIKVLTDGEDEPEQVDRQGASSASAAGRAAGATAPALN